MTSAVGILPLALQYGFEKCEEFLRGAHDIDVHWRDAPFQENIPVLMGLLRWVGCLFADACVVGDWVGVSPVLPAGRLPCRRTSPC